MSDNIDAILIGMPADHREAHKAAYRRWARAGYPPVYPLLVRQELARIRMAQSCGVRLSLMHADSGVAVRRVEDDITVRLWPWVVLGVLTVAVLVLIAW